jgi:hypothetical protein
VSVDSLDAACARFDELGVPFKKRPGDGRMKNIAFVRIVRLVPWVPRVCVVADINKFC